MAIIYNFETLPFWGDIYIVFFIIKKNSHVSTKLHKATFAKGKM